jgi:hypothetical protein
MKALAPIDAGIDSDPAIMENRVMKDTLTGGCIG